MSAFGRTSSFSSPAGRRSFEALSGLLGLIVPKRCTWRRPELTSTDLSLPQDAFLGVIHSRVCGNMPGDARERGLEGRQTPTRSKISENDRQRAIALLGQKTGLRVAMPQQLREAAAGTPFGRYAGRRHVCRMGRPRKFPEKGDITTAMVAERLGITLAEFNCVRTELEERGFPLADPTTGRYAVEAVDVWRLRRYPPLFPSLTAAPAAADAGAVFHDRIGRLRG